jgi:multidrug resistance efflux pump
MLKLPRFIRADLANHRARGADVAGVVSAIVTGAVWLLSRSLLWTAIAAMVAAPLSAYVAGRVVEQWQAKKNAVSKAHGGEPLYTIEKIDVLETLRGGVPVMLPLIVFVLISRAVA